LLCGFDWPGRSVQLAEEMRQSAPDRRREILLQVAGASDDTSRALLVRSLEDPDPSVRLTAATLAGRRRIEAAAPVLIQWLGDPRVEVRATAARALGAIGSPAALGALVRALGDADVQIRVEAIRAVAAIGGPDVTVALLDRVSDPESAVRVEAVRALGRLGDPRAVLSLLGSLQDPLPEGREAGATALGQLRDARALRGLLGLLHDPSPDVRKAAARALGSLGAEGSHAVDDLAVLALRESNEGDVTTRGQIAQVAVESLGRIGGDAACDVLVQVFRTGATVDARMAAEAAADALGRMPALTRARIPSLVSGTPESLLGRLIELLGAVGGDPAAQALLGILDRPGLSPALEGRAWRSLGQTGSPSVLVPLLTAAASPPQSARRAGARGSRSNASARVTLASTPGAPATGFCASPLNADALAGVDAYAEVTGSLDPLALDPLLDLLRAVGSTCLHQSSALLRLVGRTRNPRAVAALTPWLSHREELLRRTAAEGLADAGVQGAEDALAGALADTSSDVRLAATDALARHGDARALDALTRRWRAAAPLDRTHAARAMGRVLRRTASEAAASESSGAAVRALGEAVETGAPGLRAAALDALADAAAAGHPDALASFERWTQTPPPDLALPVVTEALGNALASAETAPRARLLAALDTLARSASRDASGARSALRAEASLATLAWARRGVDRASSADLLRDARESPTWVAANAAGALARALSPEAPADDVARVTEALCAGLRERVHVAWRANALLALARVGATCPDDPAAQWATGHRSAWVRRAAAEALAARLSRAQGEADVRALSRPLEQCATSDRDAETALRCAHLLRVARSPGGAVSAPRSDTIDAVLLNEAGVPAPYASYALALPDGVIRLGVTGPDGWIHERAAPRGRFVLIDPSDLTGE
jgi:HEAT repeat protein